jgi:hypothetical protein
MSNVKHINRVIEQAKQQRADYIGTAVQAYALPAVLVAGLSLMLVQFSGNPPVERTDREAHVAQVTMVGR